VADPGHDDVIDPLVGVVAALAREDSDRRSPSALRAAGGGRHDFSQAAGDYCAPALGQQAADVLRPLLVLAAAADHGDLNRHGCDASGAMGEFERAFALMDRLDERTAERLEPTPYGPVVVHTRLNRVHDLNFLRADRPGDATAEHLAAEAERVQAAARIGHRRVNIRGEGQQDRLEPQFVRLGWQPQHFVVMALRRGPDRPAEHDVRKVEEPVLRPLWAEAIRNEPHGKDERLVEQILEHRRDVARAMPTQLFAAEADGKLVAHTELYSDRGVGQVENVVTLPAYRGRGLARALVLRAVAESRAAGNDLTFLVADADDWPQQLYERLGFETIGRYARFLLERPSSF
jgi:ribosomal protein S18 acetylase RimI-like enzyme